MLFQRQPIELPGMIDPPEIGRQSTPVQAPKRRKRIEGQGELLLPIDSGFRETADHSKEQPQPFNSCGRY